MKRNVDYKIDPLLDSLMKNKMIMNMHKLKNTNTKTKEQ